MADQRTDVVGLDLSITATGIASALGVLSTCEPKADGDQRLVEILDHLAPYMRADLVVIEGPVVRSSAAVVIGMLQGVVRAFCLEYGHPYLVVSPATLKKFATGKGNATKADLRMALYRRCDLDVRDDNQVDAAWLRLLGLHLIGEPAVVLPKTHTDCLAKLALPAGFGPARRTA